MTEESPWRLTTENGSPSTTAEEFTWATTSTRPRASEYFAEGKIYIRMRGLINNLFFFSLCSQVPHWELWRIPRHQVPRRTLPRMQLRAPHSRQDCPRRRGALGRAQGVKKYIYHGASLSFFSLPCPPRPTIYNYEWHGKLKWECFQLKNGLW